jgi:hypothetical protein
MPRSEEQGWMAKRAFSLEEAPRWSTGFLHFLKDTEIIRTSQNGCLFFRKLICNLKTLRLALGDIRKTFWSIREGMNLSIRIVSFNFCPASCTNTWFLKSVAREQIFLPYLFFISFDTTEWFFLRQYEVNPSVTLSLWCAHPETPRFISAAKETHARFSSPSPHLGL